MIPLLVRGASLTLSILIAAAGIFFYVGAHLNAGGILYGDASCDGLVNSVDSALILQRGAGLLAALPCPGNADVNGDGQANSVDSALVLQFGAGLIDHLGPTGPTCDPSYPTVCIAPPPPDLNCPDIPHTNFPVLLPDPHHFDTDGDGIGCETTTPLPTATPQPPTPTRTPTNAATVAPTATRTPTVFVPTPVPTTAGCTITFASFYDEADEFCGNVTGIQKLTSIPGGLLFDPIDAPPGSSFAVVFMSVRNFGSAPDDVGIFSFRLRDASSRGFTVDYPDELIAQFNAEDHFSRDGIYETIQPGLTRDIVVVFLVPSGTQGLVPERCPITGCEDNLPTSSAPLVGCPLSVPDFYTDADAVCVSVTDIQFLTTIPASDFTDEVTAPPGSRFAVVLAHATNFSNGPTYVGDYSFRLRDGMSRIFTMDFLDQFDAQLGVEDYFGRHGSYETIQAGVSYEMAFVFLVPNDATGLFAQRCPPSGCA